MTASAERDAREARALLRRARQGALATGGERGPHAALVTPATDGEGAVLLLLSGLSAHTKALAADGRCALLVTGDPADGNPQTAPRVTVGGEAERLGDADRPDALARFLAIHPYSALYAGFADFSLWRLRPRQALFVGGFGRARTLDAASFLVAAATAASLRGDERRLLRVAGPDAVALDADGLDLRRADGGTVRLPFDAPVDGVGAAEAALGRLAARRGVT